MADVIHEQRIGRRRDRRYPISANGTYRTGSGTARSVELTDLSQNGCKFIDHTNRLSVGTRLTIRIGGVGPFDALVSWIDSPTIGLRFTDRLYPPYFDKLVATWKPGVKSLERRSCARAS